MSGYTKEYKKLLEEYQNSQSQIECYTCIKGNTETNTFYANVCPDNWTIDENPCNNNTVNTSTYEMPEGEKLGLNKNLYNYKDVMGLLDMNFSEFNPKPQTPNNFFKLYNENFYELTKTTHNNFIVKSEEWVGRPANPRNKEIANLKDEIERLQIEIDSIEKEHPYFTNGSFLMHKDYNKDHVSGFGGISSGGRIRGPKYYMHSGKKRRITDDYSVWSKIKNRFGMKDLKDTEIIQFLYPGGLNAIADGPKITRISDLFLSAFEINMYRP